MTYPNRIWAMSTPTPTISTLTCRLIDPRIHSTRARRGPSAPCSTCSWSSGAVGSPLASALTTWRGAPGTARELEEIEDNNVDVSADLIRRYANAVGYVLEYRLQTAS